MLCMPPACWGLDLTGRDSCQSLSETDLAFGFHDPEVYDIYAPMDDVGTEGVPDTYGRVR
jgi:hypothetical protein